MDGLKWSSLTDAPSVKMTPANMLSKVYPNVQANEEEESSDGDVVADADIDLREVYFLIMQFLSAGPCQRTCQQFWDELAEHELLPRRYHAWYSRSGAHSGEEHDDGISFPLQYSNLVERYSHIEKDHLVKLLKQLLMAIAPPFRSVLGGTAPSAADVPTLLGTGSFSLVSCHGDNTKKHVKHLPSYLHWPHMQADQVHGLSLREIGGGFSKHHRAPSIRFACYAIAKPSTMVQKMQVNKKLRGHRDAVYCAIFDRAGRYIITGSDDRLVKIWSMETAFCLASCRGHEGDITDLAVSSNNAIVASASNDYSIRVWRLPDGHPISVLKGHAGAVTAIAFSPRPNCIYQLLSSSDDGTCRIWDARYSQYSPRVYLPKPSDAVPGKSDAPSSSVSSSNMPQSNQILCCAYNASGTVFVTGSSDTFARVWSAIKCNPDDPEKPSHEIDILAGHENDVNYVQFSGCAVTPRSSTSDCTENIPKFKNSWFSHDNIVTCSRDGSAIIWIPRSRRSHGKLGRWTRAYHLKVPPPPMPPQPPRGGPRQRFLPTPRGVNMIVWSLDNRFVLAAIMDCRICVWNASDGSLVHSLTGHTASTYVLDVHPFNPRIAMSAGYDGKTIVWDIWEGNPIRIYEIGRFKLVDGKFSPDGTSIVLSDDVGQIYLLNTGQGESQKDARYDQFFLGDYRPLIQDTHGNIVDQETQLAPYRRNLQDPLCDSGMIPYPEPYQSMYQRRRLGALGLEWRPSTIKFAVGTDIPLADLDIVTEPLPDLADAIFWEPENDLINEDSDSEFNVTAEYSSEGDRGYLSVSSSSDSEFSEGEKCGPNRRDSLRRSKRKKRLSDVEVMNSYGRRVKKRVLNEQDGSASQSKRTKKSGHRQKASSQRKFAAGRSTRPNRAARLNTNSDCSLEPEYSLEEDEETSESDSSFEDSECEKGERGKDVQSKRGEYQIGERESFNEVKDGAKPRKFETHEIQNENRKRLVLKFSIRNKGSLTLETTKPPCDETGAACSTFKTDKGLFQGKWVASDLCKPGLTPGDAGPVEMAENHAENECKSIELPVACPNNKLTSSDDKAIVGWGEVKARTSKRMQSGEVNIRDSISSDCHHRKNLSTNDPVTREGSDGNSRPEAADCVGIEFSAPEDGTVKPRHDYPQRGSEFGFAGHQNISQGGNKQLDPHLFGGKEMINGINQSPEVTEKPRPRKTIIKIKPRSILADSKGHQLEGVRSTTDDSEYGSYMEKHGGLRVLEGNIDSGEHSSMNRNMEIGAKFSQFNGVKTNSERTGEIGEDTYKDYIQSEEAETEFPDAATDAARRARSLKLKATSRQTNVSRYNFRMNQSQTLSNPSQFTERASKKTFDHSPSMGRMSTSNSMSRSNSLRVKGEHYQYEGTSSQSGMHSFSELRKSNWLLLSEQEVGHRYIPQLNDEVMYIRQGHEEYLKSHRSLLGGPLMKYWQNIRAVELCLVEDLSYATHRGSGESCCEITLKFVDPSSKVEGQKFKLTLPDLINSPDFLVERTWYDASIERNWTSRDKCLVWWTNENEQDGLWWEGRIQVEKDKSNEFPGSPWERFQVRYNKDENDYFHSPWELHDPDNPWEHPHIDPSSRKKILGCINKLLLSATRNKDYYGILKLKQVAQRSDFMNRFPVPLSPDIIELRLENNYYRRMEALKHDIKVMLSNAQSYFDGNRELSKKMKNLSHWFEHKLSEFE